MTPVACSGEVNCSPWFSTKVEQCASSVHEPTQAIPATHYGTTANTTKTRDFKQTTFEGCLGLARCGAFAGAASGDGAAGGDSEQVDDADADAVGEFHERGDAEVLAAGLDGLHVLQADAEDLLREGFLGETARAAKFCDPTADVLKDALGLLGLGRVVATVLHAPTVTARWTS